MEDILASIRRIIAEDPPGSRPEVPQAPKTPAPPAAAASLADPHAEPTRQDPVFSSRPSELDFPRMSPTGKREVEAIPVVKSADSNSIDDQLTDVLGTVRRAVAKSEARAPAVNEPPSSAAVVQAALDSLIPATAEAPALDAVQTEAPAPRFTYTRDGFVPARESDIAAPEAAPDPFEFSLGPSPFARAPASERGEPERVDRPADPFGSLVPSRDVLEVKAPPEQIPAPAPAQPSLSSLRAAFAPAAEPARNAVPDPVPAPAAFIPAAGIPQSLAAPPAREDPAPRPLQAPSLGEIATMKPDAPAWGAGAIHQKPLSAEPDLHRPASAQPSQNPVAAPVFMPPPAMEVPAAPPSAMTEAPVAVAEPAPPAPAVIDQIAPTPPTPVAAAPYPAPQPAPVVAASVPEPASPVQSELAASIVVEEPVALQPSPEVVSEAPSQHQEAVFEEAQRSLPEPEAAPHAGFEPQPASQQALVSALHDGQSAAQESATSRSMEDTVAELLRPMLRSWLAENMPRIVERALRKELDESSRSEHKSAAE